MPESATAIEAVTAECPMSVYERLGKSNELVWDRRLSLWVAVGAERVREVLEHSDLAVRPHGEPIPTSLAGTEAGGIFAAFARMSEGAEHQLRKDAVVDALDNIDAVQAANATRRVLMARERSPSLHELQFHIPVMAMGEMLGVTPVSRDDLVEWTSTFVRAFAPGAADAEAKAGEDAASRLVSLFSQDALFTPFAGASLTRAERIANAIGLVFQTHDATAGLIGNLLLAQRKHPDRSVESLLREVVRHDPPVHNTRRYATKALTIGGTRISQGDVVLAVLASVDADEFVDSIAFGHGRHRCPGEHIALAIAKEVGAYVRQRGPVHVGDGKVIPMHVSGNVRIPDFRLITESREVT